MMTREDMLRELELLPVWQLRAPTENQTAAQAQAQAEQVVSVTEPILAKLQTITYIASDDGDWLFVLDSSPQNDDEAELLRNIFKAMRLQVLAEKSLELTPDVIASLQENSAIKCIVIMGETATRGLLKTDETLENLRGKLHGIAGLKLAPTYDVKHLLQAPTDKAKTWHDLCLAMQALQEVNTNI
ncbi:MAG TPA: hypothetical protein PL131_10540 [Methylotenera sp.]|nr:hypothetical protein [Methylotenera sp.]HPH06303.1 hypothetical protein [Methylotenera sp.]HPN00351.1 hypothetical protein [Methylotenera sp.]